MQQREVHFCNQAGDKSFKLAATILNFATLSTQINHFVVTFVKTLTNQYLLIIHPQKINAKALTIIKISKTFQKPSLKPDSTSGLWKKN